MGASIPIFAIITSLHLIAFVLAVGAERRRSTAKVVPDKYDEMTYCVYATDASTVYGLSAFGLLLISQTVLNGVTKCLCFGKGMLGGRSTTCAVFFFIFSCCDREKGFEGRTDSPLFYSVALAASFLAAVSVISSLQCWFQVSFVGAEACLLAGSARNAYHTKYRGILHSTDLSCATLRKGVFAAGAALSLLSMIGSIFYYWAHSKADTGGWEKQNNEGVGMTTSHSMENQQQVKDNQFEKI